MGRDDERTWTELVESFHASTDSADRTWPDAENIDSGSAPSGIDDASSDSSSTTRPGLSDPGGDPGGDPGSDSGGAVVRDRGDEAGEGGPPDRSSSHDVPEQPRPNNDEHFVPPTPPPIPRTDLITMLAWFGVFGTPVLFIAAYVLDQSVPGLVSLVAATAFIGGFAVLISRLRGHDPHDPDSGAVV